MNKKISLTMILILIFLMVFSIPAFAAQTKSMNPNLKVIMDQLQSDMNKAGVGSSEEISAMGTTTVNIGTNVTFSSANAGNCGSSGAALGTHCEGFSQISPAWADSGVWIIGNLTSSVSYGSWAWIGNQIYVGGSGSRSATITYNGNYSGKIYALATASAAGLVRMSVVDLGTGTDLGGVVLLDTSSNGTYGSTYSKSFTVTLQAGHSYALRMGVATSAYIPGPAVSVQASSAFANTNTLGGWTPGPGGYGINYSSIALKWN